MRSYLTPAELVADLLAPMTLKAFYAAVKPGGDLDRSGFPAPVPWAAGRKKKYDRAAVVAWKEAVTAASVARVPVDLPRGNVVNFPAPTGASGWEAWCEQQAAKAANLV